MKVVENENAFKIIKAMIPENILKLNPVIAGGFIVSLYHLAMRYSSPVYDADLALKIERATGTVWYSRATKMLADLNIEKQFGDIDFWFLKDNKIWEENHPARFLIKDFIPDEDPYLKQIMNAGVVATAQGSQGSALTVSALSAMSGGVVAIAGGGGGGGISGGIGGFSSSGAAVIYPYHNKPHNIKKTYKEAIKDHPNLFANFGLAESIDNSSYWANTFTTDTRASWKEKSSRIVDNLKIQIVKKDYESIDELFTKFDMLNCCAAYYDGLFYFHDEFERCSNEHVLEAGDSFFKPTTLGKIWSATRSFKYAKRFDLEFTPEVCESITDTFVESEILLEKIEKLNPSELIDLGSVEEINDPYGKNGVVSASQLSGMIMALFNSGPNLFTMKAFDKNKIFVFMNSKHHAIKEFVKNYVEKESELFRQRELEMKQNRELEIKIEKQLKDDDFVFDF